MLFAEALETVKCIDEGVIESVADANIGSILGIGFPAWTGGVLQYINGYDRAASAGFVARARELAATYGERFEPPASLVEQAERGEPYPDGALSRPDVVRSAHAASWRVAWADCLWGRGQGCAALYDAFCSGSKVLRKYVRWFRAQSQTENAAGVAGRRQRASGGAGRRAQAISSSRAKIASAWRM